MKPSRILISALLFFLLAVILANFSGLFSNKTSYIENLKKVLYAKTEKAHWYFKKLEKADEKESLNLLEKADKDNIIIVKYINDSLALWSSNSVPIYEYYPDSIFAPRIVRLLNSFYYVSTETEGKSQYVGLILIKSRYPYDNDFLNNGFNPDFKLPENSRIRFQQGIGLPVYDSNKTYLFNVIIPSTQETKGPRSDIATLFLFIGFILMGIFFYRLLLSTKDERKRRKWLWYGLIGIILLRIIQLSFSWNFSGFVLFDPYLFADFFLVPSLGDLLLNSLIIYFSAILISKFIKIPDRNELYPVNILKFSGFHLLVFFYFIYANYFCYSLIFNSSISFQPNEIDKLSFATLLSYLVNGINFLSFAIMLVWLVKFLIRNFSAFHLFRLSTPVIAVLFFLVYIIGFPADYMAPIFFIAMYWLFFWYFKNRAGLISYSFLEFFLLIFTLYIHAYIVVKASKKEDEVKTSLAVSLANEHDPVAEYLFENLSRRLARDTTIFSVGQHSFNSFANYLKKNYFSGYWNKYDMLITPCTPVDSVLIESPDYQWYHCYQWFNSILNDEGYALPNTHFYYLENYTGRISYIGKFVYHQKKAPRELTLYIELDSRLSNNLLGYPELLLDKKLRQNRVMDKYSYAKYHSGTLVAEFGPFSYSRGPAIFGNFDKKFYHVKLGGYDHLLYRPNKENLIVLSSPSIKFLDLLVVFSYMFLFYYLIMLIYSGIQRLQNPGEKLLRNLRSKIQVTIVSVLLISLFLIAGSTIWLSIGNYKKSQNNDLNEKIQSVLVELSQRLGNQNELTKFWRSNRYDNLNQLLIRFSNVFYSDINLYDTSGDLIATSRMEIFQLGLQGQKMDPIAYYKMQKEKNSKFIHREKIGNLSYLSAYVPFENSEGKLLAYLNLPYFTKQKDLQGSISALILTIVNIYIILILITIVVTILISDQITRPLELLQKRFRELKLGGRHERIDYKGNDEIANLVAEYNRMVIELEKSVDLLARSERESAWREMAKQIAHEIKNPLTPMRLSVQQLERSWKDKREDFGHYMEHVCETLIEQIDNLSAIASEFSNFAKMPVARNERVNLVEIIQKTVGLFTGGGNYSVTFSTKINEAYITADKEQLSRGFLNIIKNGIQAVQEGKHGEINISLTGSKNYFIVKISDNGKGIPDEIKPKLFMPNFTTKTSGMGIGLALVKNMLDQIDATIDFETSLGKGTTFIIQFPKVAELT